MGRLLNILTVVIFVAFLFWYLLKFVLPRFA